MTRTAIYAIRRLNDRGRAWCWSVEFTRAGKHHIKRFYDRKLGGKRKALAAATAWRNKQLARIKPVSMREFHQRKRSTNTSGVPGVQFVTPSNMPAGMWQARLKLSDGKEKTKGFGVRKHGFDEAFARAVAARRELLTLVEDRPYIKHPTAKQLVVKGVR